MDALIPVNSLSRHIAPLQDKLSQIAGDIIASGYYVLGPNVKAFEQEFAGYCGARHCVSVANGTDALELSLKALGIGQEIGSPWWPMPPCTAPAPFWPVVRRRSSSIPVQARD